MFGEPTQTQNELYVILLGRPADPCSNRFYEVLENLNEENEPVLIGAESISLSQEFMDRFAFMTHEEVINEYYMSMFNRKADPSGLAHWKARLDTGEVDIASIGLEIFINRSFEDGLVLERKLNAALVFSKAIDTQREKDAYKDGIGIEAGRNYLNTIGFTSPLPSEQRSNEILETLAVLQLGPVTAVFPFKAGGNYVYAEGEDVSPAVDAFPVGFYLDQHVDAL